MAEDISNARRIKGILNTLRDIGVLVAVAIFFFSVGYRPLFLVFVVYLVANVYLAKGSRLAAASLAIIAVALAANFQHEYRIALDGLEGRIAAGELSESEASGSRSLIEMSRVIPLGFLALGFVYVAAFGLCIVFARISKKPRAELDLRERVTMQLKRLRAGLTWRAALSYSLSAACALVVLGPGIVDLAALALHVEPSALPPLIRDLEMEPSWQHVVIAFAGVFGSLFFLVKGKRLAGISLEVARSIDRRRPILLLRSFQDDTTPLARTNDARAWMRSLLVPGVWTLEESIEQALAAHGPLIAIGRPGEQVPPAGAAREYVPNELWRARVKEHIQEARVVVVIAGKTEGLAFEYGALVELGALDKLVLVFPPVARDEIQERWTEFGRPTGLQGARAASSELTNALAAYFVEGESAAFVSCRASRDEDSYRIALERALGHVLDSIPRVTSRS